jgi:PEP-CTERM motif
MAARAVRRLPCAVLILTLAQGASADTLYQVTVDTTGLSGTAGTLAFDFTDGGLPSNEVTISNLASDGTFGASATTGAVSGSAPSSFTLHDTAFFSELVQGVTLGKQVSFELDATTNAPSSGSLSDTLSFFILDSSGVSNSASAASLITTTDPTQANSLFTLQIDGTPGADVSIFGASPAVSVTFGPVSTGPGTGVPEPGTLPLMACALGAFAAWRWHRRRYSPCAGRHP